MDCDTSSWSRWSESDLPAQPAQPVDLVPAQRGRPPSLEYLTDYLSTAASASPVPAPGSGRARPPHRQQGATAPGRPRRPRAPPPPAAPVRYAPGLKLCAASARPPLVGVRVPGLGVVGAAEEAPRGVRAPCRAVSVFVLWRALAPAAARPCLSHRGPCADHPGSGPDPAQGRVLLT